MGFELYLHIWRKKQVFYKPQPKNISIGLFDLFRIVTDYGELHRN